MYKLVDFLFPAPALHRSSLGLLTWWESRRLKYNLIVGTTGLFSLGFMTLVSSLPPKPYHIMPDLRPVLVFGLAANVCYTAGWLVELGLEKLWGRRALPAGPTLFRQGLSFSVGLTILPSVVTVVGWFARVFQALF